jgi:hypothetical protein
MEYEVMISKKKEELESIAYMQQELNEQLRRMRDNDAKNLRT